MSEQPTQLEREVQQAEEAGAADAAAVIVRAFRDGATMATAKRRIRSRVRVVRSLIAQWQRANQHSNSTDRLLIVDRLIGEENALEALACLASHRVWLAMQADGDVLGVYGDEELAWEAVDADMQAERVLGFGEWSTPREAYAVVESTLFRRSR